MDENEKKHVGLETIVLVGGSYRFKAGFAGVDTPLAVFPSLVGRPKYTSCFGYPKKDAWMGDEALSERNNLTLKYPIKHGIVVNWDDMEKIWHHAFYNELRVAPEEHPILLTEVYLNPKANRERTTQIMFETFNVPSLTLRLKDELVLYSSGRSTGVVLSSGHEITHSVPIYQGYAIIHAAKVLEVGGEDLNIYLRKMLDERHEPITIENYTTKRDILGKEIVEDIKERLCFVSQDYEEDIKAFAEVPRTIKTYQLPEGKEYDPPGRRIISLQDELFRCPEALFKPDLIGKEGDGVHSIVVESIMNCPDEDIRQMLFENIVVDGGSTRFEGFIERLQKEIENIVPGSTNLKLIAHPEGEFSELMGGRIVASLPGFKDLSMTSEEYDEYGPPIVHRHTSRSLVVII